MDEDFHNTHESTEFHPLFTNVPEGGSRLKAFHDFLLRKLQPSFINNGSVSK